MICSLFNLSDVQPLPNPSYRRPACRPWVPRNEGTECSTQTDPPYKHLAITPAIPEARTQGIGY